MDSEISGVALLRGGRSYMEDFACVHEELEQGWCFGGIFDGHCGGAAASYCAEHMHKAVASALLTTAGGEAATTIEAALAFAFEQVNASFLSACGNDDSGTTALVVLRRHSPDGSVQLVTANVGDSRAILHDGTALTRDFKPDDEDETARIEAAGGSVFDMEDGCGGRVVGPDNVSMLQVR